MVTAEVAPFSKVGGLSQVVYFLAGESASAITGQCINVDCGTLPQ